jgi:hypothetical protein
VLGRPDAQDVLRVEAVLRALRPRPFLGVADIRRDAESSSDAGRDVAHRPVYFDMADAARERLAHQDLMAVGAGKLAVRGLFRPADAVPERLDTAALLPARPAWDAAAHLAEPRVSAAALALYKPGAVQSAA